MDEKEIQATMARLVDAWTKDSRGGMTAEALKLSADALMKFTRLVVAIEIIASCQMDVTDAMIEVDPSLETTRPEGTC